MSIAQRLLIFLYFATAITFFFVGQRFWKRSLQRRRNSWLTCYGRVENAAVTIVTGESCQCEITYSYQFQDERYGGCFRLKVSDEQGGWDLMRPFQDQKVTVEFDSRDPTKSAVVEFNDLEVRGGRYIR